MRNLVFCLLILGLDVVFALMSAHVVSIPGLASLWQGVPVAVLLGVAGIIALVVLNFIIAAIAMPARDGAR